MAAFSGAVLLDIVYASVLSDTLTASQKTVVYSHVSDALLKMSFFVFLAAGASILSSWRESAARNLFIVSVLLFFGFEFLTPTILMPSLRQADSGAGIGPWIRILAHAIAVTIGLLGLWRYEQSAHSASRQGEPQGAA